MPRNPQIAARTNLEKAVLMDRRAQEAGRRSREALNERMVQAVSAGLTRYEVGKICGVSGARVAQIPGMPQGRNGRRD